MTLEQLEQAFRDARGAVKSIEEEQRVEMEAAKNAVLNKFKDRLSSAKEVNYNALSALLEYKDANASHPMEGRLVYRMWLVGINTWGRKAIQQVGIVEICRKSTQFPENQSRYAMPRIGEAFVRVVKKDGTPGIKVLEDKFHPNRWTNKDGSPLEGAQT